MYLSDVTLPADDSDLQLYHVAWKKVFRESRWFTRGWMLQELVAPSIVEFYSKECRLLGTKVSLEQDLHDITEVPKRALRGSSLSKFSIDERRKWSQNRQTTIKEDEVYCLLGIFEVFIPLIYGEGKDHVLTRLMREVQRQPAYQMENLTTGKYWPDTNAL